MINEMVCANCSRFEAECKCQSMLDRGNSGVCLNWHSMIFPEKKDNVNHPSHYETGKFECIDVMLETQGVEAVKNFCICNAFKYLYRHNNKNGEEDIKKAKWYIDKYLELSDGPIEETTILYSDGVKVDEIKDDGTYDVKVKLTEYGCVGIIEHDRTLHLSMEDYEWFLNHLASSTIVKLEL